MRTIGDQDLLIVARIFLLTFTPLSFLPFLLPFFPGSFSSLLSSSESPPGVLLCTASPDTGAADCDATGCEDVAAGGADNVLGCAAGRSMIVCSGSIAGASSAAVCFDLDRDLDLSLVKRPILNVLSDLTLCEGDYVWVGGEPVISCVCAKELLLFDAGRKLD